jgi:hypothetical protein
LTDKPTVVNMGSIWNADGSTQQQRGTGRAWGGGAQTHSIFGWADEKVEVVVSETRSQGIRGSAAPASENRPAAGFKAATEDAPAERKVNETKLKDIQGHNIFDNGDARGILPSRKRDLPVALFPPEPLTHTRRESGAGL